MNISINKVQQITSKGQITLPVLWRKKFNTEQIVIRSRGDLLEILPFSIPGKQENLDYTVFDAIRDGKGKGLKADDLLKLLKKINND
ncbi:MAG: hypothetical protein V1688_03520 [bacterium]